MEPVTTSASGFAISKIYYALAGLFGGFVLSFFWQPAKLRSHGRMAAGAIIGGISVGSAVIFGGAVSVFFGMNPNDANTALAVGGGIGLVAVAIVSLLANFFDKREGQDILEVVQEVRGKANGVMRSSKSPGNDQPVNGLATKKPAAKKAPAKKAVKVSK